MDQSDGSAATQGLKKDGKWISVTGKKDSLKLIEKQHNAFRLFRATNAFSARSKPTSALHGNEDEQVTRQEETDTDPDHEGNRESLLAFMNYVHQKFAYVGPNEIRDSSFILKDDYLRDISPVVAVISGTIREDISRTAQFEFRRSLYTPFVENKEVFFSLGKLMELQLLYGWLESDMEEDQDSVFVLRFLCNCVLVFLINGVDCHPSFGERLTNQPGFLEVLVLFVRGKKTVTFDSTRNEELTWQTLTSCVQVFYNCSLNDKNRQRLTETGVLEASLPFIDSSDPYMGLVALLAVAYLADEKQSEVFKAKKGPVQLLVDRVSEAVQSEEKRDRDSWTASELIRGLGRLALNDANKSLIAECGAVTALIQQAKQDQNPDEQLDAIDVLWTLSFDKGLRTSHQFDEGMVTFKSLTTTTDHACREAAKGILWNLKEPSVFDKSDDALVSPYDKAYVREKRFWAPDRAPPASFGPSMTKDDGDGTEEKVVPYIMISYQWDSQDLILKIKTSLEANGYKVWLDLDKMEGSILESMAAGVEGAAVVLICCSKKYKDSQNCRAEAEYTYTKKKEYIPLFVEKRYKPDGWLGIMVGAKLYYSFTRSEDFEKKLAELMKALGKKGQKPSDTTVQTPISVPKKVSEQSSPPSNTSKDMVDSSQTNPQNSLEAVVSRNEESLGMSSEVKPTVSPSQNAAINISLTNADVAAMLTRHQSLTDVKNWDAERVRLWIDDHKIERTNLEYLSGPHLHFLRRMKLDAPALYYQCLQEHLHIKDFNQMVALTNALEDL